MLQPKKTKFRKMQKGKGRDRGVSGRGNTLAFGDYGLMATSDARITARQIEAARIAITRRLKRGGRVRTGCRVDCGAREPGRLSSEVKRSEQSERAMSGDRCPTRVAGLPPHHFGAELWL